MLHFSDDAPTCAYVPFKVINSDKGLGRESLKWEVILLSSDSNSLWGTFLTIGGGETSSIEMSSTGSDLMTLDLLAANYFLLHNWHSYLDVCWH